MVGGRWLPDRPMGAACETKGVRPRPPPMPEDGRAAAAALLEARFRCHMNHKRYAMKPKNRMANAEEIPTMIIVVGSEKRPCALGASWVGVVASRRFLSA